MTADISSRAALRLTRHGPIADPDAVAPLRVAFDRQQCVKLHSFLEPALFETIQRLLAHGAFAEFAHGALATELLLESGVCTGLLHFLANDPRVFQLVEEVAGVTGIRSFGGRVYRRFAGQHYDNWHGDLGDPRRLVGMSVNLSADVYDGGVFEIRDVDTERPIASLPSVGFGDAILFRLSHDLEHRVSDVEGMHPKTAFAGWFLAEKDFTRVLHRAGPG